MAKWGKFYCRAFESHTWYLTSTHFQDFIKILRNFTAVNDRVERIIKLIQDLINATRDEDHLQNVLFVSGKNRVHN